MALEHSCPSAGDIGDGLPEADHEPDPDRIYEQEIERRAEIRKPTGDA